MADLTGVNYTDYEETSFEPIPEGQYVVILESSDLKTTKAGDGQYLKCSFQVIDGDYKGRKVVMNMNIENKNDTARNIGRSQLNALCKAANVLNPSDSCQLHDIPVIAKVKVVKDTYKGEEKMQNDITDFEAKGGAPAPAAEPETENDCPL